MNCPAEGFSWRPGAAVSALPLVPLGAIRSGRSVAESRNNSCENPRVGGSPGANLGHESPERSSSGSLVSCVRRCDMPHRSLLVLLVAAIATVNVLTGAAQGQTPAPPPLTYERVITMT